MKPGRAVAGAQMNQNKSRRRNQCIRATEPIVLPSVASDYVRFLNFRLGREADFRGRKNERLH